MEDEYGPEKVVIAPEDAVSMVKLDRGSDGSSIHTGAVQKYKRG